MHLAIRKELLVQCALLLAACEWLGSDAASSTTVVLPEVSLPTTTYQKSVTKTASTAAVSSSTSVTTETTRGAVSTQGSTARAPLTTASASNTSAVSNATAGTVTKTASTAADPSRTSVTTETTRGAVSTQGSTARAPLTTASASTTSAVSNATAALDLDAGCNDAVCLRPHCTCASDKPPAGLRPDQMPQFVTLTFDDAVTVANMAFYRELLEGSARKNKASGCGIAATFFVSHEYTDYAAVNALHSWGNEIAVHSISHRTDWNYWHTINSTQWERELLDQKIMMQTFANVPASHVTGVRGPFLYTGGDQLFRMQAQHFRYDCTLVHQRVRRGSENPVYPYTMDFGFRHSCMVYPCPERTYPGLWVMPMNVLFREYKGEEVPCAMADACLPQPITANDTFEYLRSNFEDFYTTNRAPFPLFLHEAYLREPRRKQGYLQFIDWLLQKDDVYLVTISEVLRFMQDPKPLGAYVQHACPDRSPVARNTSCPQARTCAYKNTSLGGDRYMMSCSRCPKNYPWVGNPLGN
ncbi:chitin deacetylase 8 isoform X3 [Dermacentor silvarum]|uniref:chitin deacetylase 8 isoform X3 n=1 Tax=Dermacentor silvarum TaxID=543639 RepID=UPI0018999E21|nr:chitin deacetylase 8 isoform X3 [Dermacentor silvarum]